MQFRDKVTVPHVIGLGGIGRIPGVLLMLLTGESAILPTEGKGKRQAIVLTANDSLWYGHADEVDPEGEYHARER